MSWWARYPTSRPREAKGGIKAQSQRGAFGQQWWAKRWIGVLESFNIGARLSRGRSYARGGQVLKIEIGKGAVQAAVQGSRPTPYQVAIRLKPLPAGDWDKVAKVVSSRVIFASKLLAGEMPQELEEAFGEAGVALFPQRFADLTMDCSCPDWSNPCKHTAAVFYLIGEEFDRDPFLILRLRGMDREEFLKLLGPVAAPAPEPESAAPPEPLPGGYSGYWAAFAAPAVPPLEPAENAVLARRLGSLPFWRGHRPLVEFLDGVHQAAAASAASHIEAGPV